MSGAGYVLIINFSLAALFATTFMVIAQYDTNFRSARWFAASYVLGIVTTVTELLLPLQAHLQLLYIVGFSSFLLAVLAGVVGVSRRYAAPPPWMALTLLFIASVIVNFTGFDLPRDSLLRQFGYQAPLATGQFLLAWVVLKYGRRNFVDRAISVVVAICALTVLARPLLAAQSGGTGADASLYINTAYAAYSQTIGGVCAIASGLLFILAYVQDILRWRRDDEYLDRLTGLLSLSGFASRTSQMIKKMQARPRVGALVVLDIDRLDHVNSAHGYDAGDQVITAFAEVAKSQMSVDHVSGRIGGDNFGIFMPGSSQSGAMEFAETLRAALFECGGKLYDGDLRPSASLGLVMLTKDMDFEAALLRAKGAVAIAKGNGRNCLHLASDSDTKDTGRQFRSVQ